MISFWLSVKMDFNSFSDNILKKLSNIKLLLIVLLINSINLSELLWLWNKCWIFWYMNKLPFWFIILDRSINDFCLLLYIDELLIKSIFENILKSELLITYEIVFIESISWYKSKFIKFEILEFIFPRFPKNFSMSVFIIEINMFILSPFLDALKFSKINFKKL